MILAFNVKFFFNKNINQYRKHEKLVEPGYQPIILLSVPPPASQPAGARLEGFWFEAVYCNVWYLVLVELRSPLTYYNFLGQIRQL